MGLLRLFVHDDQRLASIDLARVHMVGFDDLPWFGHVFVSDNQLIIERAQSDSGSVCVPYEVADRGELLLATSTLMERDEPYFLEVELARGVVNRLRNQMAAWQHLGLVVNDELKSRVAAATAAFVRAASRQHDPPGAASSADQAIQLGTAAAEQLAGDYAEQALALRLRQSGKLNTLWGVDLSAELPDEAMRQPIVETFNLVAIPMAWRTVEASEGQHNWTSSDEQFQWARNNDLKIVGGPLLDFDERRVPDWTYLWEGDYDSLASFMLDHVQNAVKRYRGKVNLWHVAARMNRAGVLALNDEERLQVVATAVRTVKDLDPRTPVLVSFDQPWAEYMAGQQVELAPIHFADALVRADLGLAGIGLELNVGAEPRATAPRMPIDLSRLVDGWGLFELPLFVILTADTRTSEREGWVEHHLPALLAKNCVQVVLWNQLSDSQAEFEGAGLFDEAGNPKPALNALKQLRQQYLT
ncbi:MAG: endo-1,4-beta-xylanase [Aeoliella sp.]